MNDEQAPRAEEAKNKPVPTTRVVVKKDGPRGARAAGIVKVGEAANFVWGIPSGLVTTAGRILSVNKDRACDVEELEDTDGEVDGAIFLNNKTSGSLEALVPSTFTDVELATALTVDGATCFTDGFKKNWERRGWAKYTINFRGWDLVTS
jgi:hypothetical protein